MFGGRRGLIGAAAVGVVALVAVVALLTRQQHHTAVQAPEPPAQATGAQIVDYTIKSSLLALAKSADLICECTVLAVSAPYSATPRVDGAGVNPLPIPPRATLQDYEVRVDRAFRATGAAPTTVTVAHAGSRGETARDNADPPLLVGSRYVLFLRRAADGRYGFVSGPQGRLLVDAANRLQPVLVGDKATALLQNSTIDQLIGLLRASTP